MTDTRTYPKAFLSDFIELYKNQPCLWKVKSKEYSDRNKKTEAYDVLINKLRQVEPYADRDTVVKKINSLRSCYRKELKKVKKSMKRASRTEEIYRPHLWYFHLLDFLSNQESTTETASNLDEAEADERKNIQEEKELQWNPFENAPSIPQILPLESHAGPSMSGPSHSYVAVDEAEPMRESDVESEGDDTQDSNRTRLTDISFAPTPSKKPSNVNNISEMLTKASQCLQEIVSKKKYENEQSCPSKQEEAFGKYVIARLKNISDPMKKRLAEKKIVEILFNVEFGWVLNILEPSQSQEWPTSSKSTKHSVTLKSVQTQTPPLSSQTTTTASGGECN